MKRSVKAVSYVCAAVMAFSGMSVISSAETDTAVQQTVSADETKPVRDNVKFGKVTAVSGNTITLSVAQGKGGNMNKGGKSADKLPDGQQTTETEGSETQSDQTTARPGKKKRDKQTNENSTKSTKTKKRDKKTDEAGTERPEIKGDKTKDNKSETLTITITDENIITKNGESASLSDITENTMLRLTYNESGELTSVEITEAKAKGCKVGRNNTAAAQTVESVTEV